MPLLLETRGRPEERALRQLAEAALFEGLAEPDRPAGTPGQFAWRLADRRFRAAGSLGAFGRPRIEPFAVETADGAAGSWRPAALADLAHALAGPGAQLADELRQSVELAAWNAANLPPAPRRDLAFATLDAALDEGHPYHPSFKARTGFTLDDHRRFGPEAACDIRLEWLAVARGEMLAALPEAEDRFWQREIGDDFALLRARMEAAGAPFSTHALMPVHPWQLGQLAADALRPWLADGRAVALGPAGDRYRASQSLRTLHNRDRPARASVKLPLDLVSTSSSRRLDPCFVLTAPALSRWLEGIVAADPVFAGPHRLELLPEYAALLAGRDGPLGGGLAAIFRRSPRLAPGEAAVPLNALMAVESDGEAFLAPWVGRHGVERWAERLVEVVALPLLHLLLAHGVALEAHGQNTILVHRDGWPERLILRDFHESAEFCRALVRDPAAIPDFGAIDPAHAGPPDDRFHEMREPAVLAELVTDALFVFNLAEIAHLLRRLHGLDETRFWRGVGERLRGHARRHGLEGRLAALGLEAPRWRVEALLARKLGLPESRCSHLVPNPLHHQHLPETGSSHS